MYEIRLTSAFGWVYIGVFKFISQVLDYFRAPGGGVTWV